MERASKLKNSEEAMSNILPIDNTIVPADITQSYIQGYSVAEQRSIAAMYETIESDAFSKLSGAIVSSHPTVILVAGSQGSGKSRLVETLKQKEQDQFVECDVDSILKQMPVVKAAIEEAETELSHDFQIAGNLHYSPDTHRAKVESAVAKYRPAAKYISDRLMSRCISKGINVIVETNAKTPRIKDFIDALQARHVVLKGHICEAPLPLKVKSARTPEHGFAFPEGILISENAAFRKNIPTMMAAMKDNITVWFRLRENEPSKKVISIVEGGFSKGSAFDHFDALFSETNPALQISKLFDDVRPDVAPKVRTFVIA